MQRYLLFLFLILVPIFLHAEDVSLAWDASITPTVTGYKVYIGPSTRTYNSPIIIGNQTTYTVTGLTNGTYFFTVSAFDDNGNESDYSNEVSQIIGSADVTPPVLSGIGVSNVTFSSAHIQWMSDENATGKVYYGKTIDCSDGVLTNSNLTATHSFDITNLVSDTNYCVKVESVDVANNKTTSNVFAFLTSTSPSAVLQITSMSASKNWYGVVCLATTSVKASAIFKYSKIQSNSGWTTVIATPTVTKTQHRVVLYFDTTGETEYYNYTWLVTDSNNITVTGQGTFRVR